MAPPADLPRSLRRAAARPAGPRGRQPSVALRDAAAAGVLTRSNTTKGTAGRRAATQFAYRARTASRPEGVTARAAAGHEPESVRHATSMSAILAGGRFAELSDLSRADRRRIARYNALASNLATGDLSPGAFHRRVDSWRPIAGERFESTPRVVLAVLTVRRESGEETFIYRGRRS